MRRLPSITALTLAAFALSACLSVVVEGEGGGSTNSSSSGTEATGDGDPGDGDGDGNGDGDGDPGDPESFRVVVLADPHIPPDGFDPGQDISLALAHQRLLGARDKISAISPAPAFVVVVGDLVHAAYSASETQWYLDNDNAFTAIAEILDGFPMPVYPVFGESDYGVPDHSKLLSHQLFAQFFAKDPYYSVDRLGWRFVFTNSQFGQTFDSGTINYDVSVGSYGGTQLSWLGAQLEAGSPTVLFTHFPLGAVASDEALNNGPYADIDAVLSGAGDTVALILAGHEHQWSEDPDSFVAPQISLGSPRFDTDNFMLLEFTSNADQYQILDYGKIGWGTQEAETWTYQGTPAPAG